MKKILPILIIVAIIVPFASCAVVPREFLTEVTKGNIPGHELALINAHNEDVGTSEELLWQGPYSTYIWPTTAKQLNVTSTDVNDDAGDTGARIIFVQGLDSNYNRINETVIMDGQNRVLTTNSYLRINQLFVTYSGSTGTNEGDIYIGEGATVAGVPTIAYYMIDSDYGYSFTGVYTVPNNWTLIVYEDLTTTHIGTSKEVENYFHIRILNPPNNRTDWKVFEFHSSDIALPYGPRPPFSLSEKTDIFFTGECDVGSARIAKYLTGIIIHDSVINNSTLDWSNGDPSFQETQINSTAPVDVNVIGDVMSTQFIAFIVIAFVTMWIAWSTEVNRDAAMWYGFSLIWWIATMIQWILDEQSIGMIWVYTVPISFCVVQFINKNWFSVDDATENIRRSNPKF